MKIYESSDIAALAAVGVTVGDDDVSNDIGPQKQPSSVAKIQAETKAVRMQLRELDNEYCRLCRSYDCDGYCDCPS